MMRRFGGLVGFVFLLLLAGAGCQSYPRQMVTTPPMAVDNTYAHPAYDHAKILNVLVLPFDHYIDHREFNIHHQKLILSLLRNFGKFNYFNVHYDPDFPEVAGSVVDLDIGEIDRIKLGEVGETYNAQAVMQVSIQDFRPYPPMRMKVRAALFDTNSGERIWEFDHVFDTDDAEVVNALRVWWNSRMAGGDVRSRFELSRIRPSVFSNFVFYTMAHSYGKNRLVNARVVEEKCISKRKKKPRRC